MQKGVEGNLSQYFIVHAGVYTVNMFGPQSDMFHGPDNCLTLFPGFCASF